jgi:hypothetical protein
VLRGFDGFYSTLYLPQERTGLQNRIKPPDIPIRLLFLGFPVEREGYKNILNLPDGLDMPDKITKILKTFSLTFYYKFMPGFYEAFLKIHRENSGRSREDISWDPHEKVWPAM